MILNILKVLDGVIRIGIVICSVRCLYIFCMGDKSKNETLWYGLFLPILLRAI